MQPFLGRNKELEILSAKLLEENNPTNLICITGETGIGKTALAHQLLKIDEQSLWKRFKKILTISIYMEEDWSRLVTNMAKVLDIHLTQKITSSEIVDKIIESIINEKILLLLDSADQINLNAPDKIRLFLEKWLEYPHLSALILTGRQKAAYEAFISDRCISCTLGGISEVDAVKNILGSNLVQLIEINNMWVNLGPLGSNPLKLTYLRWGAPTSKDDLTRHIEDIAKGLRDESSLEKVLQKTRLPLIHFLALGQVRATEFEETLLAFLWDRLGGGSTEIYIKTLKFLISEKLLLYDDPINRFKFRINAEVHMKLKQPLQMLVGVSQINYFISVYYRNLFTYSKDTFPEIHYLERYVYHALQFGSFDQAYLFVFESDILENAHNRGLAIFLKPILEYFDRKWLEFLPDHPLNSPDDKAFAEQGIRIKIELGNVYNDLSMDKICIECMEQAKEILNQALSLDISQESQNEFNRKILFLSAVSSSKLGQSYDCLNSYYQIVKNAVIAGTFEPIDALSLGYLAQELRYHDIKKAKIMGENALLLVEKLGQNTTIIKNMCSLGQTLFFLGELKPCKRIYEDAYQLSGKGEKDLRELGRLLVHSSTVYIAEKNWDEATRRLDLGVKKNQEYGDRRRAATSEAYHAIISYKNNKCSKAKDIILNVIKQHKQMRDWRNLSNEVLSYVWMDNHEIIVPLLQLIKQDDIIGGTENSSFAKKSKPVEKFDVFLCHNSKDKPLVKEIWEKLRENGISSWLDEYEITPSIPWLEKLGEVIDQIPSVAIFIGENGIGPWQEIEISAIIRTFVERKCPVIPVILKNCNAEPKLSIFLRGFQNVDFRKHEPDPMRQLIKGITSRENETTPAGSSSIKDTTSIAGSSELTFEEKLDSLQKSNKLSFPDEIIQCITYIHKQKHLHIFVDFWNNYFKPQLLER